MKKISYIIITIIFIILISLVVINVIKKDETKETLSNENLYNDIENTVISEKTLNIEKNSAISKYIPNDITEISIVKFFSYNPNATPYTITDIEKIKKFIELFTGFTWTEIDKQSYSIIEHKIIITGSTTTNFNMMRISRRKWNVWNYSSR